MSDAPATTALGRAKQAMEVVTYLCSVLQGKDKEIMDAVKEKKRSECRAGILEKEKLLLS